jgi:hypothetical protein|tara:strand:- start:483 stop:683 length:201 start_codon:yes stop_codon:yes gene_type:complete
MRLSKKVTVSSNQMKDRPIQCLLILNVLAYAHLKYPLPHILFALGRIAAHAAAGVAKISQTNPAEA